MRSSFITLYIDTSSSMLIAGIVKDNILLTEIQEILEKDLSTYALSRIEEMFRKVQMKPNDIDRIIVVNGPGSFTGIRIGITIAKTYAWALKKKITTITSLEAMAISTPINQLKVPIIDARRGYVFAGIYNQENQIILENQYINLDTLIEKINHLKKDYAIVSNDLAIDNKLSNVKKYTPDILKIVVASKEKQNENPHAINPKYLKKTEAEEVKGITIE